MKRLLAWILILTMAFSLAACGGQSEAVVSKETPAEATEETSALEKENSEEPDIEPSPAFPALGDAVEGFVVKEIRDFPLVGGQAVLFEHEKTGAELIYIANSDINRVFDLTFFTRAIDKTGLPHVFEHSTLDGSAKYPSKSLFFNLSYQTYNTFMNAMTQARLTTYPVASLSEAQLLKYADYYTDSCLHPMILEDESIFREEAWRYRMNTPEDPLTIEGTVYSEMLGAMDLTSTALMNAYQTAFPGSTIGNEYGGEPQHIPEMTFESLCAYHDMYYHPSNCIAYLYGSFEDYTAFLRLLDEAFSPYEKREFTFEDTEYEPLTESVETSCAFPVESGSDTLHSSALIYTFLCPGLREDPETETLMNTLTDLFTADASPLMQRLRAALPYGDFGSYIEIDAPDDAIVFYGFNLNPDDADVFRKTVDTVLVELAKKGFSDELADSVAANLLMSLRLIPEESGYGVDVINDLASYYAASDNPFGFLDYVEAMEDIFTWHSEGDYQAAISDWLLGDVVTALTITYPEAGLREKLDTEEAERLAKVKAAMSEEEIQTIIESSNGEEEEDDASRYVALLQAETVETLPEEIRSFDYSDLTGEDGVRRINVTAEVDGVGQTALFFDASGIAQEDLHWFSLYTSLVGNMGTKKMDRETLAVQATRLLYGSDIRLSLAEDRENKTFIPRLRAGWIAADEDLEAGYDLMYEILFETDFSDAETLLGLISREKATLKSTITAQPYSTMLYRALGYYAPLYRYYSYVNGLEYYAFLEQVEQLAVSDPEQVAAKLKAVQEYFHNRTNAAAVYVGSEDGISVNDELVASFMSRLDASPVTAAVYDLPSPAANEALIVDSPVQYNGIVADYPTLGLEAFSGEMDAVSALVSDAYLYPRLRDGYGAYGVISDFIEDYGTYVVSYRDPNIAETFAVYEAMPDFVAKLDLGQEEIDGYILSSYANYATPDGELSGGMNTALDVLTGDPVDADLQYMRDLKTLTPEVLTGYGEVCAKLIENGVRFTAGGAAAIAAEADRYDVILNPFGAVDSSSVELTDVPEDNEHYDAVRFVFEHGLILSLEEDCFGVDETATVGDFASALYALLGGDASDQDAAVEYLQGYEIIPSSLTADTELTGSDADEILAAFSWAVEDETEPEPITIEGSVTRGELAEILFTYAG